MDQYGNLYVDSEDGAGPNAPELEGYAPMSDPDLSPTAISLATTKGTLPSPVTITVTVKDPGAADVSSFPNGVTSNAFTLTITSQHGGHRRGEQDDHQ